MIETNLFKIALMTCKKFLCNRTQFVLESDITENLNTSYSNMCNTEKCFLYLLLAFS